MLWNKEEKYTEISYDGESELEEAVNEVKDALFGSSIKLKLCNKGMHKNTFYLHLKETEFRYNYRNVNLYKLVIGNLKKNPLKLS